MQRAAHAVGKALDDGHAEPCALHLGDAAVLGAGIVLADVLDELLAHANAVILAGEAVAVAGQAFELHVDVSTLAGILDGVGDDVDNDPFQPPHVAEDHAVRAVAVDGELLLLLAREGAENVHALIQAVRGAEGLVQKLNRTVLELVDVQNRVDEHKQVVALGRDVAERVFELVVIVFILARSASCRARH